MFANTTPYDKYRVLPEGAAASATQRYRSAYAAPASVDALLGLDILPAPPTSAAATSQIPRDGIDFEAPDVPIMSPLDAWAEAFGIAPPAEAQTATPPTPDAAASRAAAVTTWPSPKSLPSTPEPATTWTVPLGPCPYPSVGGGFDCTRDGMRIILPPIRWPLLPPLAPPPPMPSAPTATSVPAATSVPVPVPVPTALMAWPTSPRPHTMPQALARAAHTTPQPRPAVVAPPAKAVAVDLQPAWRCAHYTVPPFIRGPGESLRRTHEFFVLQSPNARRQVWHYCSVMAQPGVFAGHFEVHALSQADIAGDGCQRRIIVYSRGALTGAGRYQLAMDTHPEGPAVQPRVFLLHDAQANHYRFLTTRDTTRPKELLTANEAQAQESGGAGDCLFFSVARGLGYGGYHQQAATRLRRMATSFLYHHPDASLNGDTLALFVNKL